MNTTKQIKEVVIEIPEGYIIDEEKSTFTKIIFKKDSKKMLPKTWEELQRVKGFYVSSDCHINSFDSICDTSAKNTVPTKELTEAMLALCQLLQLRDSYNDNWVANQNNTTPKYCIEINHDSLHKEVYSNTQKVLHFKRIELRREFLENFKDLIEIAKSLI